MTASSTACSKHGNATLLMIRNLQAAERQSITLCDTKALSCVNLDILTMCSYIHCVSKNDTDVAHYNLDVDQPCKT